MILLTEGILKSIDSAIEVECRGMRVNKKTIFVLKYKGNLIPLENKLHYISKQAAEKSVTDFVYRVFWNGAYWQSCEENIKGWNGYQVDFSATLNILHSNGETSRFEESENKQMFKDIAKQLLEQKIFTIEEIEL